RYQCFRCRLPVRGTAYAAQRALPVPLPARVATLIHHGRRWQLRCLWWQGIAGAQMGAVDWYGMGPSGDTGARPAVAAVLDYEPGLSGPALEQLLAFQASTPVVRSD